MLLLIFWLVLGAKSQKITMLAAAHPPQSGPLAFALLSRPCANCLRYLVPGNAARAVRSVSDSGRVLHGLAQAVQLVFAPFPCFVRLVLLFSLRGRPERLHLRGR